jgi:hypothetical protein
MALSGADITQWPQPFITWSDGGGSPEPTAVKVPREMNDELEAIEKETDKKKENSVTFSPQVNSTE